MSVKDKARNTYNKSAQLWHQTRVASLKNTTDAKLLKQNRPHLFIEKPAMYPKVPDLTGKKVLCLGCGSGEETEFLLTKRPIELYGVDISKDLIEIAKKEYPEVNFAVMDAENLKFENEDFDFIYSSLVLDYFKSWKKVLSEITRVLRKGGIFLFSDIHPVKWSGMKMNDADGKAKGSLMGYDRESKTGKQIIYGDYLNVKIHNEVWMKSMEISCYSRPLSMMLRDLVTAGFEILDMLEPKAIEETKKYDLDYWEVNQKIPNLVIFECRKK